MAASVAERNDSAFCMFPMFPVWLVATALTSDTAPYASITTRTRMRARIPDPRRSAGYGMGPAVSPRGIGVLGVIERIAPGDRGGGAGPRPPAPAREGAAPPTPAG